MVKYIASQLNSGVVLPRLWVANKEAILRGLVALYEKDPNNIGRVLDVCQASSSQLAIAITATTDEQLGLHVMTTCCLKICVLRFFSYCQLIGQIDCLCRS